MRMKETTSAFLIASAVTTSVCPAAVPAQGTVAYSVKVNGGEVRLGHSFTVARLKGKAYALKKDFDSLGQAVLPDDRTTIPDRLSHKDGVIRSDSIAATPRHDSSMELLRFFTPFRVGAHSRFSVIKSYRRTDSVSYVQAATDHASGALMGTTKRQS